MATSFSKTYSVDVTFKRADGGAIADSDIQSVQLRNEIKKAVDSVCRRTKGIFNTQPGSVSES